MYLLFVWLSIKIYTHRRHLCFDTKYVLVPCVMTMTKYSVLVATLQPHSFCLHRLVLCRTGLWGLLTLTIWHPRNHQHTENYYVGLGFYGRNIEDNLRKVPARTCSGNSYLKYLFRRRDALFCPATPLPFLVPLFQTKFSALTIVYPITTMKLGQE